MERTRRFLIILLMVLLSSVASAQQRQQQRPALQTAKQLPLPRLGGRELLGKDGTVFPRRSKETIVLQTTHGTLKLKLWPDVAPQTTKHILRLFELGLYQSSHLFRIDKGFVAQVADVESGRRAPLVEAAQRQAAAETVPLEVKAKVKHDRAGLLSMARTDDPNSGRSSFSIMLGAAPHLDQLYTLFGEVLTETQGQQKSFEEFKKRVEALPTRTEGIFVMPKERVEIVSTFVLREDNESDGGKGGGKGSDEKLAQCLKELKVMEARWKAERGKKRASSLAGSAIP